MKMFRQTALFFNSAREDQRFAALKLIQVFGYELQSGGTSQNDTEKYDFVHELVLSCNSSFSGRH